VAPQPLVVALPEGVQQFPHPLAEVLGSEPLSPLALALGRQALAELLRQDPALQAVYCSSDQLAQGVLTEAQARGLRIPEDLAVCGFGNADFAAHMEPSLTTVHVDGAAIGRLAARLIVDRCRGQPVDQRVIDVGFRIVERRSTGGGSG